MNYKETLNFLYESAPMFQQVGKSAYKEGLSNTYELDEHFNHPHQKFKTIHIAGTNGKGSCSHTLAAILQSAGYKVGLYTSPHLIDFRERIRINGEQISEEYVIKFVEEERSFFEPLYPSFFELTTAMAFKYFADQKVDVAVIEVGLGGRLDCTNVIRPDLCIITNISFDHTQFLGKELALIAAEKAGIMKNGVPVVIGETTKETKPVFTLKANEVKAPIFFAEEEQLLWRWEMNNRGNWYYFTADYPKLKGDLGGFCQLKNTNTVLLALRILKRIGYNISQIAVEKGFSRVCELTGLMGRWQKLGSAPTIICDTGHNTGGITYIADQLSKQKYKKLHIVLGMVNDKDINGVLALLPKDATYYFTKASVKRALYEADLQFLASKAGLTGNTYTDVPKAFEAAKKNATDKDFIFVGGSSFIVADLLIYLKGKK
ncbi:folylpolyglutamate synthase/dihydrofolate synthase family protein [uncultured Bacteroides sp.]|uniref:bifunctional folylpolyglutamate synthase/dihydrofolate synthase n=1 Tax=uncultured Bacteroides sp. TaxID=162156 RepID=UPI002AAB96B5|nr:folylpolyglutamate synthase/dihydrofolate synthase family protein [uncultured Bacteroides sp.]